MDTAGQDEYTILPTAYSNAMDGYVLVYDITNRKSFEVLWSEITFRFTSAVPFYRSSVFSPTPCRSAL